MRHLLGIAAHVDIRAPLEQLADLLAVVAQVVLHIHLAGLVARGGHGEMCQGAGLLGTVQLVAVEIVVLAALAPEEEHRVANGLSGRLGMQALLDEAAERREAGAGADHDDRDLGVDGQAEAGLAHKDRHAGTRLLVQEICGRDSVELAAGPSRVPHNSGGDVDGRVVGLGRGGDGVVAGLEAGQQLEEIVDGGRDRGHVLENVDDVPLALHNPLVVLRGVLDDALELLLLCGVARERQQLADDIRTGPAADVDIVLQRGGQGAGAREGVALLGGLVNGIEREDCVQVQTKAHGQALHEHCVVGGVDGNMVTGGIADAGGADVQLDVAARALVVRVQLAVDEHRRKVWVLHVEGPLLLGVGIEGRDLAGEDLLDGHVRAELHCILAEAGVIAGLHVEGDADGGPHGVLPRIEVVLEVGIVVTIAARIHAIGAELRKRTVEELADIVELFVGLVAQAKHREAQSREIRRLAALGFLEPVVEVARVVGRLALSVCGEAEKHQGIGNRAHVCEILRVVVLHVRRHGLERVAACLLHEATRVLLGRARLRAEKDDAVLVGFLHLLHKVALVFSWRGLGCCRRGGWDSRPARGRRREPPLDDVRHRERGDGEDSPIERIKRHAPQPAPRGLKVCVTTHSDVS
eukprot:m.224202 g.224202  ORF g.224202 m.224202 type:complete len:637 (+) comp11058_c0_seq1:190-2100(+)